MGLVSKRVSDVSGEELDSDYVNIAIRNHSKLAEARQVDVTQAEANSIQILDGLVELEFRPSNGEDKTVYCTEAALAAVVPIDVLKAADTLRGRRKNFKPNST